MADGREGSVRTAESMFNVVGSATDTADRKILRRPTITESKRITKATFVQSKSMTFQRQSGKPGGCTLLTSKFQGQLEIVGQSREKL